MYSCINESSNGIRPFVDLRNNFSAPNKYYNNMYPGQGHRTPPIIVN
jgi:hypothetical protein